jgi:cysteine-rich repeat protein
MARSLLSAALATPARGAGIGLRGRLALCLLAAVGCAPLCGDSVLDPGEACDDGNNTDADGCQSNCQLPACGDLVLDGGEACDDGNTDDADGDHVGAAVAIHVGDGERGGVRVERSDAGGYFSVDLAAGDLDGDLDPIWSPPATRAASWPSSSTTARRSSGGSTRTPAGAPSR